MAAAEAGWRRPGCKDVLVSVVQVSPWLFDLVLFENAIVVAWTYREAGGGGGGGGATEGAAAGSTPEGVTGPDGLAIVSIRGSLR